MVVSYPTTAGGDVGCAGDGRVGFNEVDGGGHYLTRCGDLITCRLLWKGVEITADKRWNVDWID